MKTDIILCGVGGQGVLSLAAIIAQAAMNAGYRVRQSEVHGMAQRGGAVLAHLRIADSPIACDLVPLGCADLILSMEPVESLRYLAYLAPGGALVTAAEPFINIPDYPELDTIYAAIKKLPQSRLLHASELAKTAGSLKAVNMVMVGSASHFLPFATTYLEGAIHDMFALKAPALVPINQQAFALGRQAGEAKA